MDDAAECVVDEFVVSRHRERRRHDGGTTRQNGCRLDVLLWLGGECSLCPDVVPDRADQMAAREQVRAADAEEHSRRLSGVDRHRAVVVGRDGVFLAVHQYVRRLLAHHRCRVEGVVALLARLAVRIDVVLANIELVVDLGQAVFGFDEDDAEHATRDVVIDLRDRTVVDERSGVGHREPEPFRLARLDRGRLRTAARSASRVEVDVVDHRVALRVGDGQVHRIADARADERSRHLVVERHVLERDAGFDLRDEFPCREFDVDGRRLVARDGLRDIGRVGRDTLDVDLFGRFEFLVALLLWVDFAHAQIVAARLGTDGAAGQRCRAADTHCL